MRKTLTIAALALTVFASCKKEQPTIDYKTPDICMTIASKPEPKDGKYFFTYTNGKTVEVPKLSYETSNVGQMFCQLRNLE